MAVHKMSKVFLFIILTFSASLIFGQSSNTKRADTARPFVLGIIEELRSKELNETRTLNIYLPEGYNKNDTTKYPVIYLLDGSANEDFIHIVGLVQFYSFEWIKQIPPSIVVGIATVDRKRDFTFPTSIEADRKAYPTTGHAARFMAFIEKELQPFIGNKYRTNSSKTIIGQSLGGLLATGILFEKPMLFDKYIIVSPRLWWNNGSLLSQSLQILKNDCTRPTDIYIGVGKEGLTPTAIPRVMEEDAKLLSEKIKGLQNANIKVYYDYLPQEDHATILHQAVANSFKLLYTKQPK